MPMVDQEEFYVSIIISMFSKEGSTSSEIVLILLSSPPSLVPLALESLPWTGQESCTLFPTFFFSGKQHCFGFWGISYTSSESFLPTH